MDWPKTVRRPDAPYSLSCFVRVSLKSETLTPVSYYRGYQPAFELSESWDVKIINQVDLSTAIKQSQKQFGNTSALDRGLLGTNIVLLSRLYRREGLLEFVNAVHTLGGLVVMDTDDDLSEEFRELDGRGDEFVATMQAMDLVTVSTPHLSKRMERFVGYRPPVLPNHIAVDWFSKMSSETSRMFDGLTIGLLGTASHYGDWHYPVEALKQIKEEHPEVTILMAGYFPDYLDGIATKVNGVPYSRYPGLIRQFDIVLCSLDPDDNFNKSKSAIKALESMASARDVDGKTGGAVAVCTDMPVYRRVVTSERNGLLAPHDDWYPALKRLVTDDNLRKRLAVQGYKWVGKHRNSRKGKALWSKTYRQLIRRNK